MRFFGNCGLLSSGHTTIRDGLGLRFRIFLIHYGFVVVNGFFTVGRRLYVFYLGRLPAERLVIHAGFRSFWDGHVRGHRVFSNFSFFLAVLVDYYNVGRGLSLNGRSYLAFVVGILVLYGFCEFFQVLRVMWFFGYGRVLSTGF